MLGLVGAGIQVASGLAKALISNGARKDYESALGNVSLKMPSGINEAEAIYSEMMGKGMAGKDAIESGILENQASSIEAMKNATNNSNALLNSVVNSSTQTNDALMELGVKDAQFKDANSEKFAQFLSRVKAPNEQRINQFEVDKKIAIAKEEMQRKKDIMDGITGGMGGAFSSFGKGKELEYLLNS